VDERSSLLQSGQRVSERSCGCSPPPPIVLKTASTPAGARLVQLVRVNQSSEQAAQRFTRVFVPIEVSDDNAVIGEPQLGQDAMSAF
jgi:hypothetical protein